MAVILCWAVAWGAAGCSSDMGEQPSYQPQETPRRHSPAGSIPQESRAVVLSIPAKSDERLEHGRRLYRINCAHCHGPTGEGNGPVSAYLTHPATDLHAPFVQAKPEPALYAIVTNGLAVMPSFQGELSADERWAVAHFVKSLAPSRPVMESKAESTPNSKLVEKGRALFQSYCVSCHGAEGRGNGPAAAMMNPKPTDLTGGKHKQGGDLRSLQTTIAQGVPGTSMPPFGYLPEDDRQALARYVKALSTAAP